MQHGTKSSVDAEGPRDAPLIRKITLEKACNGEMTFNGIQGHRNFCYQIGRISLRPTISDHVITT